jgi:hypothetical protein
MPEHIDSVNSIALFFREQARETKGTWPEKFTAYAVMLEKASAEMARLYGMTSALPPDLGNVFDLQSELLEELSIAKADEIDDQLVTVINAYGGEASLDQILVGLYRKFKVSQKRRFLQNKLYRMDMVWNVEGRKGMYTTTKPSGIPRDAEFSDPPSPPPRHFALDDEIPF